MQNDRNNSSVKIFEDCAPSIVSSEIVFLRNIDGFNFVNIIGRDEKKIIENKVLDLFKPSDEHIVYDLEKLTDTDREIFLENGLIGKKFYNEGKGKFIVLKENNTSIIINSEEHVTIKIVVPGLFTFDSFKLIESIENKLSLKLQFAASTRYGYLTSNIKNCGLAMKTSVLLHLKGIKSAGKIDETVKLYSQRGYSLSPWIYNKENDTEYFKVSSRMNFGVTEEQLYERFKMGIVKLININKEHLNKFYLENKDELNDTIYRSFGILTYASQLNYSEALSHLSNIRTGLELGLDIKMTPEKLNKLFILIKNGHVKKLSIEKNIEENKARAELIKTNLNS